MTTLPDYIYKRALAVLWSAGHTLSMEQRLRMRSEAYRFPVSTSTGDLMANIHNAACDMLCAFGYAPDRTVQYDLALPEVQTLRRHMPAPGHAVRIDGNGGWMDVKPGDILTLSSCDDHNRHMIGKGRHYLNENGSVSISSGGPASVIGLRTKVLQKTDDTLRMPFWRFHMRQEANAGVDFTRPVPVWTWDGSPSSFENISKVAA